MPPTTTNTLDIATYQEWERRAGPGMRARYADFAPHQSLFEIRADDIPRVIPGFRISQADAGLVVVSGADGQGVAIHGLSAATLATALALPDGQASMRDLAATANPGWPLPVWRQLLQTLLGTAIEIPATFSALTKAIKRTEIVRFPEQPARAVWRNYWENAATVRRHLPELYRSLDDLAQYLTALARLHILATVGHDGQSYYGGYGLIPTVPGGYREAGVQTAIPDSLVRTLDHWASQLGAGPVIRAGQNMTTGGRTMAVVQQNGGIVIHPAIGDALRSLLNEARLALKAAHEASSSGRLSEIPNTLAIFHQIFVNAHPFTNINNSIAMNVVNDCLRRAGLGHIPHLFLDYLAQRLPPDRYAAAFARAVELHALPENDPTARNLSLANSTALYSRYRLDRDGTSGTA